VSFTQNLFMLVSTLQRQGASPRRKNAFGTPISTNAVAQVLLVLTYFVMLAMAPSSVGTGWFFPMLLSTRVLLFAPFVLIRPRASTPVEAEGSEPTRVVSRAGQGSGAYFSDPKDLERHESRWTTVLVGTYMAVQVAMGVFVPGQRVEHTLSALHDSPAVSALGYDLLLGIFSVASFRIML
jgi:hypothetical protein